MGDTSARDFVNHDRAGPCEDQREGTETFASEFFRHPDLRCRRLQAHLFAPLLNLRPDFVANDPDLFEFCRFAALRLRRIGKAPMHSRRGAWENRTFLRGCFVADGNHPGTTLAPFTALYRTQRLRAAAA